MKKLAILVPALAFAVAVGISGAEAGWKPPGLAPGNSGKPPGQHPGSKPPGQKPGNKHPGWHPGR
jgi:hypothetical protein